MTKKIIGIIMIFLLVFSIAGCNAHAGGVKDDDDYNVISWDDISSSSYDDIEYIEDVFYDFCVYDANILSIESVEAVQIEYKDITTYFDEEKIYEKLGLKLKPAELFKKVAIGTGVVAVCLALNIMTAGGSSTVCCIIAGAANGAITGAANGAIIGGIVGAIANFISSDGDWYAAGTGAIEGATNGYMWGAIFGAVSGAMNSSYCFTGDTLVYTKEGRRPISDVSVGDYVYAVNIETNKQELSVVDEVYVNKTKDLVEICTDNQKLKCTPNHTILTNRGWKYAYELSSDDRFVSYDKVFVPIRSVKTICLEKEIDVYNLNVRGSHTYCVTEGDFVVHNTCINKEYAGETYKYDNLKQRYLDTGDKKYLEMYNSLLEKYPNGVPFSELDALGNTYPDFKEYVLWEYKFPAVNKANLQNGTCLTGDSSASSRDFKMFRQKMLENGYSKSEISEIMSKYTIHHAPDCQTLQLVPRDLHQAVRHTGGASLIRQLISSL